MHSLITIRLSHYNEKARWVLDRFSVPYREYGYMPILHMAPVFFATLGRGNARADKVSTRFSTPVLLRDDGPPICDSTDIAHYLSRRYGTAETSLYPNREVEALEQRFHDRLGPCSRRVAYYYLLPDQELLNNAAQQNVSAAQAVLFKATRPLIARGIQKGLRVTREGCARSLEAVRREFEEVGERLKNRRYLVGDRFSAADLSFACMAAPALLPSQEEGYGAALPALRECPPELSDIAKELRATRAGQYALRMFREERGTRVLPY